MSPKVFITEKIIPNLLIWIVAYLFVGRFIAGFIPGVPKVNWNGFFEVTSLIVFLVGVVLAIVLAYFVAKGSSNVAWLFGKVREEASAAIVNVSSVALVVSLSQLSLNSMSTVVPTLIFSLVGFGIAWRAL